MVYLIKCERNFEYLFFSIPHLQRNVQKKNHNDFWFRIGKFDLAFLPEVCDNVSTK